MTFPARNVIEDSPSVSNLWILETTVDNNVLVGSVSLEYDVINGKTVPICDTRSFKLERVFSGLDVNNHSLGVHIVVTGSDGGNNGTVPENVASTWIEGNIFPAGPGVCEMEFVRQTRRRGLTNKGCGGDSNKSDDEENLLHF
jgi:hypothetical protein